MEKILKPRQEEKRRKREAQFDRFFSHTVGAGHVLGVSVSENVANTFSQNIS